MWGINSDSLFLMEIEIAQDFFQQTMDKVVRHIVALPQSGSDRKNFLIETESEKYIITHNTNLAENEAFFYFSAVFSDLHLNTPYIYKVSKNREMYVQTYLGSHTLSEIIQNEGESKRVKELTKKTLNKLHELQTKTIGRVDYTKAFEYSQYDKIPILHDLFYFKFMFVDVLGEPYSKSKLIQEFFALVERIENLQPKGLMIRDFQSRNIMVDNDEVFFIDYQSAMQGPLMYDVVSFLYQAKANFSTEFREEMLEYYYSLWREKTMISELKKSLEPLLFIRSLQVLGAYGFRGLVQKKSHFIQSIEQGVKNLYNISETWQEMERFPELKTLINQLYTRKTFEI